MSKKWFGSLFNRLEENKMYCEEIKVGTGVTEYMYSDRYVYEVVEVIDQKHVFVRELDPIAVGPSMSNQWEYKSNLDKPIRELKYRYWVNTFTKEGIKNVCYLDDKFFKAKQKIEAGVEEVKIFRDTRVSFGVTDYYYGYEF